MSVHGEDNNTESSGLFKTKNTLQEIVDDFGANTTAHGIPRIITATNFLSRGFWTLICLVAFSFFLWQSIDLLNDYRGFPTVTKVELIAKSNVPFPSVTVCNMNRLRRSALRGTRFEELITVDGGLDEDYQDWFGSYSDEPEYFDSNMTDSNTTFGGAESNSNTESDYGGSLDENEESSDWLFDNWFSDEYFEYDDYYNWNDIEDVNDWEGIYKHSVSEEFSDVIKALNPTKDELMEYGHQATDFILQCTFNKRKCNHSDFLQFQNLEFGNCYTFNHGINGDVLRNTSQTGAQFGLHLTLFIEQPEYVGILSHDVGVRVSVHSPSIAPHPEDTGIAARPGTLTSIGLRQNEIYRLDGNYGNCSNKGAGNQANKEARGSHFYEYSYSSCKKLCIQDTMSNRCGCVSDLYIEGPKCNFLNKTQQACQQLIELLATDDKLECKCPLRCKDVNYGTTTSTSLWPSEPYKAHLYSRLVDHNFRVASILEDYEKTRNNLVRLKIFFEELNFQSIIEEPVYTTASLLGSLGGLLGLYIGLSTITMVEIIIFFAESIHLIFRNIFCRNQVGTLNR